MFEMILMFVLLTVAATVLHGSARRFVRNRLRYVDLVQRGAAPWIAGGATFLGAALIVGLLPFVGIGTALTAAVAIGTGVAAGARDIRQGTSPIVYGG